MSLQWPMKIECDLTAAEVAARLAASGLVATGPAARDDGHGYDGWFATGAAIFVGDVLPRSRDDPVVVELGINYRILMTFIFDKWNMDRPAQWREFLDVALHISTWPGTAGVLLSEGDDLILMWRGDDLIINDTSDYVEAVAALAASRGRIQHVPW